MILSYARYVVNNSGAGEFSSDIDKAVNNLDKLFAISLQFLKMTKLLFCFITSKRSELESRRSVQIKIFSICFQISHISVNSKKIKLSYKAVNMSYLFLRSYGNFGGIFGRFGALTGSHGVRDG